MHNKSETRATGGGVNILIPLSSLEEAVTNLLQFGNQVVGFVGSVVHQVETLAVANILKEGAKNLVLCEKF